MKGIFERKGFLFILVILLYAACVYPPFLLMTEAGITVGRKWDWIFTLLPTPSEVPEIDLVMLSIEAIIAVLLALGISLVLFGIKKVLRQKGRSHRKVAKPLLKDQKDIVPSEEFNSEMIDTSSKSDMKIGKKNVRSFLKSITPGERIWLRDGVLKQIQNPDKGVDF